MTSTDSPDGARRHRSGTATAFAVGLTAGAAAGYALTARRGTSTVDTPVAAPVGEPALRRDGEPAPNRTGPSTTEAGNDRTWPRLFEALRTGICVVNTDNTVEHANPPATALGMSTGARLEPEPLRALADHVRGTGNPRQVELELPGGTAARVDLAPLTDGHVAVELTDISELHRVERVRRDFVANVGHELKTPVGALQLLSEALADAVDDPAAAARFTQRIQHESARMSRLVSELLELSRLQGAEPLPAPVNVGIDRVVTEALDRSRTAASAKDITLIRSGVRGAIVSGSEKQLATAVSNLVGNAIAYSPDNTTVRVAVAADSRRVTIAVSDEGIGIAPGELDRIFERFYRADPARSRATGGTGLGLAIVKHIAGNHGGQVEVSSSPGNGATFTIELPAVTAPPTPDGDAVPGKEGRS